MALPKGVRVKPKWVAQGAVMAGHPRWSERQVAVGHLGERLLVVGGQHQPEVIDAQGSGGGGWFGFRHVAVDVAADDERDRLAGRAILPEHVQAGQVLGIEARLDATT
jgi:hypothetical protein